LILSRKSHQKSLINVTKLKLDECKFLNLKDLDTVKLAITV
jgi:hypothetical protein